MALQAGYTALSNEGWYLDQTTPGFRPQYAWADYWQDFWAKEPCAVHTNGYSSPMISPAQCKSQVLGGEASMWSERVDITNIDGAIWPRTAAVAERLW